MGLFSLLLVVLSVSAFPILRLCYEAIYIWASLVTQTVMSNAGDLVSIPGSGRHPGEGNGNPLQYSCLDTTLMAESEEKLKSLLMKVKQDSEKAASTFKKLRSWHLVSSLHSE